MLTIAICDDDRKYREETAAYCQKFGEEQKLEYELKLYGSGEEMLDAKQPDILLLDVEMGEVDGLRVKEILQKQKADTRIIFISSHVEAISEAFGRQVYGFLKKPLVYEEFQTKMKVVLEDLDEENRYVMCEISDGGRRLSASEISYIKADGKYTQVYLEGEAEYFFSEKSISVWNAELEKFDFAMSHRSYLVNLAYVKSMGEEVILKNVQRVPLSRRMAKEFQGKYKEFIWRKAR